jgi:hypothetical protein
MLEWVPAGLNTGALSGAKASSSRTRDKDSIKRPLYQKVFCRLMDQISAILSYNKEKAIFTNNLYNSIEIRGYLLKQIREGLYLKEVE